MKKFVRPLNKAFFFAAVALLTVSNTEAATTGEAIPACELTTLDSSSISRLEMHRGKILYVDFWASWCPPCVKSFPFMNELVRDFKDKGLEVIGINLDESTDDAKQFIAKHPAQFSIMTDLDKTCAQAFDVKAMPSSFLIDRNGVIRHVHFGFRSGAKEELKKNIELLLNAPEES